MLKLNKLKARPLKSVLLIVILSLSSPVLAESQSESDGDLIRNILATGKFTGGCGIFQMMVQFQEQTEMTGGDEFLDRFWTTEAARLGMTLIEYAQQCANTYKKYSDFEDLADFVDENGSP